MHYYQTLNISPTSSSEEISQAYKSLYDLKLSMPNGEVVFDYNTKTWSKKSNKMKNKYNKDLILFYRIFTGKKNKPANIKSFQDIP
jgi:hypothetical protein